MEHTLPKRLTPAQVMAYSNLFTCLQTTSHLELGYSLARQSNTTVPQNIWPVTCPLCDPASHLQGDISYFDRHLPPTLKTYAIARETKYAMTKWHTARVTLTNLNTYWKHKTCTITFASTLAHVSFMQPWNSFWTHSTPTCNAKWLMVVMHTWLSILRLPLTNVTFSHSTGYLSILSIPPLHYLKKTLFTNFLLIYSM